MGKRNPQHAGGPLNVPLRASDEGPSHAQAGSGSEELIRAE